MLVLKGLFPLLLLRFKYLLLLCLFTFFLLTLPPENRLKEAFLLLFELL